MSASGNGGAAPATAGGLPYQANDGNPLGQIPGTFFHRRGVLLRGRSQTIVATSRTAAPGTLRHWLAGFGNMISGGSIFNWTRNLFDDSPDGVNGPTSSPVRYKIDSRYLGAGNQRSNPHARAIQVYPTYRHAPDPVFVRAGQQQGRPTTRNRITSFGSRVPPVNRPLPSEKVGGQ